MVKSLKNKNNLDMISKRRVRNAGVGVISAVKRNVTESKLPTVNIITDLHSLDNSLYATMDEEAFDSFTSFIKENIHLLDNELKEICLMLADKMANSYHHTNKKEKELINKLKEVLGTDHVGL